MCFANPRQRVDGALTLPISLELRDCYSYNYPLLPEQARPGAKHILQRERRKYYGPPLNNQEMIHADTIPRTA